MLPQVLSLADGLDAQASALYTYAAQVQHIQDQQQTLTRLRATEQEHLASLQSQFDEASKAYRAPYVTNEDDIRKADRLGVRVGESQSRLTGIQTQWDDLVTQRRQADKACADAVTGVNVLGATWKLSGGRMSGKTPDQILDMLTGLTPTQLQALLAAHPELAGKIAQADPTAVAAWWNSMNSSGQEKPSDAQQSLIGAIPAVIGNLNGVAYWARHDANRITLKEKIADAQKKLAQTPKFPPLWASLGGQGVQDAYTNAYVAAATEVQDLQSILNALKPTDGTGPARYLIELSDDVPPLAAVSVGSLDTATNVTYAVPGMGTDAGSMKGWAQSAQNIWGAQYQAGDHGDHAVVAWIGYKTPPVPSGADPDFSVLDMHDAQVGAKALDASLSGFDAVRAGSAANVNVVAHSYGSTTSALALSQPGAHVNTFVSLGSAGMPDSVPNAAAIHADHVFAGQARNVLPLVEPNMGDEWAWTGRDLSSGHTGNPVDASFGATTFGADGVSGLKGVTDHATDVPSTGTGYLDPQTESLKNVANATTGHPDRLTPYVPKPPTVLEQVLIDVGKAGPPHAY
ncbi:alpha/beta hydrolase [Humibacter ginsengisoli]